MSNDQACNDADVRHNSKSRLWNDADVSQSAVFFEAAAQGDAQGFEKVAFRHFLWHLLGTVAGPWSQGGLEVSIDSLHRDFASAPSTCTAEKHAKGDPQRAVGGRCVALVGFR